MQWLASKAHLKTAVSKAPYDILWRYPGWFENRNAESLYRYFQAIVSVEFDDTTGIGTLRVQGFSPPDAQELASALLDAAEDLVNRLNQRAQQDAVRFAELEVENMRRRADSARQALTAFREREELIDPSLATLAVMETLSKLSLDVSMLNVQLSDLAKASPNSPQFRQLTVRRDALAAEILNQRRQLAGTSESIAPRISQYEKLVLKRDFFDKAFVASLAALHSARIEVNSRHVYLERVVLPNRPDYPSAPWRFVWAAVTLTFFVLVWRLWGIVADDVRRHAVPR
jgi:capsular polysaccharide transport system permease protein